MELKLALICDSANVSQEGKLNILGEFDTLWAKQVPVTWPSLTLVARFEAHIVEGSKHRLAIDLTDADGTSILDKQLESELPFSPSGPGRPLRGNLMAHMRQLTFRSYGTYEFHLLMDGRAMGSVQIHIVEPEEPA